jgi:hypothetical protein
MLLGWCKSLTQGLHRQTGAKIRHNIEYNPNFAPGAVPDSYLPAPKPFMPEPAPKVLIHRQVHWYKDDTKYRRQSQKNLNLESRWNIL